MKSLCKSRSFLPLEKFLGTTFYINILISPKISPKIHENMQKEWLLRYMLLLFTFTNIKQKSIIPINCPYHLHLHFYILPHQNIHHNSQCGQQLSTYFCNLPHTYKTPNILSVILRRSMPLSCILKPKIKTCFSPKLLVL